MKALPYALLVLLIACGKAGNINEIEYSSEKTEPLIGRSQEDVLRIKYNHHISLWCTLRVQNGEIVNVQRPANDEFEWPVLNQVTGSRILRFSLHGIETAIVFRLERPLQIFERVHHTDIWNRSYYMEHSPILNVRYELARRGSFPDILTRPLKHKAELFENIETPLQMDAPEDGLARDARCVLKTKIRPVYLDQWKRVK